MHNHYLVNGTDIAGFEPYSASKGIIRILVALQNGGSEGTGLIPILAFGKNILGPKIPDALLHYAVLVQNNLTGGYATLTDVVPCAVFAAIFGIIMLLHLAIFIVNWSRGHYFILSLVWSICNLMKVVALVLRLLWAKDITLFRIALVGEAFLIFPSLIMSSLNLNLGQRLFTWRHPVGGSRRLFCGVMFGLYGFICIIIALTIISTVFPYIHFLSSKWYWTHKQLVKFTAILIVVYPLTTVALIVLSWWAPTKKDENFYTYQPWWIESFHPFYFVPKGAAQKAEESFLNRNHNHRNAVRVIAATHHHYNVVEGLNNLRGDLEHNTSFIIVLISTIFFMTQAILRTVVVFLDRINAYASRADSPFAMYFCFFGLEIVINIMYIAGRADLRFYRPDALAKDSSAVTAEQSYIVSDNEQEEEEEEDDFDDYFTDHEDDEEGSARVYRYRLEESSDDQSLDFGLPPTYGYSKSSDEKKIISKTSEEGAEHSSDEDSEFYF